jgi:hypothetical protein
MPMLGIPNDVTSEGDKILKMQKRKMKKIGIDIRYIRGINEI